MRCSQCGTGNGGDVRFCNQCAAPLNKACPKCAYENTPEAKFCGQCAAALLHTNRLGPQTFPAQSRAAIPRAKLRRVGIVLLLSMLFPGWGQIYNGQFRKALWIWIGWMFACLFLIAVGVPRTFAGLIGLLFLGNIAFYLVACIEAVVCARRLNRDQRDFAAHRWYAYLGLVAMVYVLSLSTALVSRQLFFQAYKMPSGSMEPTLLIGDHIVVDKRFRTAHRGDVIVFVFPPDPTKDFIKRVVGVSGDTIEVKTGKLYRDGVLVADPHAHFQLTPDERQRDSPRDYFGPLTVPAGKLFVMGDNRDRSYDSRFWGLVEETEVEGRVLYIYWSWDSDSGALTPVRLDRLGMSVQ